MSKIIIDRLTEYGVSVKTETYADGKIISINRKSYTNDKNGRNLVNEEVAEAQKNAIFAVWGDAPTIIDWKQC